MASTFLSSTKIYSVLHHHTPGNSPAGRTLQIASSRISSSRIRGSSASGNLESHEVVTDNLLRLIQGEERGLRTQKDAVKRAQIIKAIDALGELGKESTTTDSSLTSTWRMLWTTEKEQLFIIKNAHLFGTEAGDILQVPSLNQNIPLAEWLELLGNSDLQICCEGPTKSKHSNVIYGSIESFRAWVKGFVV
jgi:hypothetical protein